MHDRALSSDPHPDGRGFARQLDWRRRLTMVLWAGALSACAPALPPREVIQRAVDLQVELRRSDEVARLVIVTGAGAEVPLDLEPLEATFVELRPFFAGPAWRHVIVRTERRGSDEGLMREAHYLLHGERGVLTLRCQWAGNEHQRDMQLRGLLRTTRLQPVEGADPPSFDLERIDYNRVTHGNKERVVTRVLLAPDAACTQQISTETRSDR